MAEIVLTTVEQVKYVLSQGITVNHEGATWTKGSDGMLTSVYTLPSFTITNINDTLSIRSDSGVMPTAELPEGFTFPA